MSNELKIKAFEIVETLETKMYEDIKIFGTESKTAHRSQEEWSNAIDLFSQLFNITDTDFIDEAIHYKYNH